MHHKTQRCFSGRHWSSSVSSTFPQGWRLDHFEVAVIITARSALCKCSCYDINTWSRSDWLGPVISSLHCNQLQISQSQTSNLISVSVHCSLISRLLLLMVSTHILWLAAMKGQTGCRYWDGLTIIHRWCGQKFFLFVPFLQYGVYKVFTVCIYAFNWLQIFK